MFYILEWQCRTQLKCLNLGLGGALNSMDERNLAIQHNILTNIFHLKLDLATMLRKKHQQDVRPKRNVKRLKFTSSPFPFILFTFTIFIFILLLFIYMHLYVLILACAMDKKKALVSFTVPPFRRSRCISWKTKTGFYDSLILSYDQAISSLFTVTGNAINA